MQVLLGSAIAMCLVSLSAAAAAAAAIDAPSSTPCVVPVAPAPTSTAPIALTTTPANCPVLFPPSRPRGPLFHPDGPGPLRFRFAVGALLDVLPSRTVESEQRQLPKVALDARFGLPAGFSLSGRVRTIAISNEFDLGVGWSFRLGPLGVMLHDHQGFFYGYLAGITGFDASARSFVNQPGISLGLPMEHVRFTLTGESIVMFGQSTTLGDATKVTKTVTRAGLAATLTVETLLDAGGVVYFGAALLWTDVDYQVWLAFSDERVRVFYPRFVAGYAF